jgi:hypothetical protein
MKKTAAMPIRIAAMIFLTAAGAFSGGPGAAALEAKLANPVVLGLFETSMPRIERRLLALVDPSVRPAAEPNADIAQAAPSAEKVLREIEDRGYSKVTGLMRRGQNYVFQAVDPYGDRVRVVMNAQTGEIVGLSRILPKKK